MITNKTPGEILIVDDTPTNLQVLSLLLKSEGYNVIQAISGAQALKLIEISPPELILLDVRMPEMDGYEVCRQIKQNPLTQDIPVIFLSALDTPDDKLTAFNVGGDDFISKPFQAGETLARVRTHLDRSRALKALERERQAAERRASQLEMLHRIGLAITTGLDLPQTIQTLYEQCNLVGDTDNFFIALYDESSNMVEFIVFLDQGISRQIPSRNIDHTPGVTGYIIRTRRSVYIPDIEDSHVNPGVEVLRTGFEKTRSFIGTPLKVRDRVIGVLSIQSFKANAYSEEQIHLLEMLATQAAIAIENSRLYQQAQQQIAEITALRDQLREQAIRDSLTNLYNRRYLEEALENEIARSERANTPISVLMIDVDLFKCFNDTYGHKAGDRVLQALANMLVNMSRRSDIVCRYGGEEFVVILPGMVLNIAIQRAEFLRTAFEHLEIQDGNTTLSATISIGIAVYPEHASNAENLLDCADRAMYIAKQAGRNRIAVYASDENLQNSAENLPSSS